MPLQWRRSMWILWIALFVVQVGFSLIMPFLSLYVQEMGVVSAHAVELWSGAIFSANFITAAIFLPIWGAVADRMGRRAMMLRASFGMGIVVALMGLATHPWQLVLLRLLQGTTVGLVPAAIAYMAAVTPKEHTGYVLGTLQAGTTAGTVIGPLVGGLLATFVGHRPIFYLTGLACILGGMVILFFIPPDKVSPAARMRRTSVLADLRTMGANPTLLAMMVVLMLTTFSAMNAEPIIPLYLETLVLPAGYLSFISGLVFSATGIADIIASPFLGRRGDTIGYKKVLLISLAGSAIMYTAQAFALTWWHVLILRFLQGIFMGGALAAGNSLISLSVPEDFQGRAFGISTAAMQMGNFMGPITGGAISAWMGFRAVFPITGLLRMLNFVWVYFVVRETTGAQELERRAQQDAQQETATKAATAD